MPRILQDFCPKTNSFLFNIRLEIFFSVRNICCFIYILEILVVVYIYNSVSHGNSLFN